MPHPVAAIVLAGGGSTRMGADKAGLDWDGRPLVAHIAAVLQAATGGGPLVVAGPHGPPPAWRAGLPAGTILTADPAPDAGPVEGLRTAFAAIADTAPLALVAGTDQPLLSPAVLGRLVAIDGPAAYRSDGRLQPLGALLATTLPPAGTHRLTDLLATATILDADEPTAAALRSLDTPAALEEARRAAGISPA